ncbi:MAG: D-alanyl-D-alanine carboxypeptidase family protein, partial [Luteimonas sp.]
MHSGAILLNTARIEAWPGGLLRTHGNHDARLLARASHVLRRKRDGRYLAVEIDGKVQALRPDLAREPGMDEACATLAHARTHRGTGTAAFSLLPLERLRERLDQLGLEDTCYALRTGLALVPEPTWLAFAGFDRYRRALWLRADAARAWAAMQADAMGAGVVLEAISGYRSHDYQLGIFARKLARGIALDEIL